MGKARGFTLLEVLIATALIGVAFFYVLGLIPSGYVGIKKSGHQVIAANLAEEILENIRKMPYEVMISSTAGRRYDGRIPDPSVQTAVPPNPPNTLYTFPPPPYPSKSVTLTNDGVTESRRFFFVVDTREDLGTGAGYKWVAVTVHWSEKPVDAGGGGGSYDRALILSTNFSR